MEARDWTEGKFFLIFQGWYTSPRRKVCGNFYKDDSIFVIEKKQRFAHINKAWNKFL